MKEQRVSRTPAVGSSSLLIIFAVLCMTVFALLGLSSVQADSRLSDTAAEAVEAYYAADCQAEEILSRLRDGQTVAGVTESDGVYSYVCPISDTQELSVQVQLYDGGYTILQWQAVSTAEWVPDDSLTLWDGSNVDGSNGPSTTVSEPEVSETPDSVSDNQIELSKLFASAMR